jgi:hypothetical protein
MSNIVPVFAWMLVILALPHGFFENVAMVGLLVSGDTALYRTFRPTKRAADVLPASAVNN